MSHTDTYVVLEIPAAAYQDVRDRLVEEYGPIDFKLTYQGEHEDESELLVLGDVALKVVKLDLAPGDIVFQPKDPTVKALEELTAAVRLLEARLSKHNTMEER